MTGMTHPGTKARRHRGTKGGRSLALAVHLGLIATMVVAVGAVDTASAQSSSLYIGAESNALQRRQQHHADQHRHMQQQRREQQHPRQSEPASPLEERVRGRVVHRELQAASFTAVAMPEPRHFAKEDLVTIIIREQAQASSSQGLSTERDLRVSSELEAMPRLQLEDLLNFQMRQGDDDNLPEFGLRHRNDFEGEGDYSRRDTMTTRLTGRVVDVKPNGTLAIEARTYIRTDSETQTIVVTGYCRSDDITPDNTILSTQMFDLRVEREHEGELRRASQKGIFTRLIDTVLNF